MFLGQVPRVGTLYTVGNGFKPALNRRFKLIDKNVIIWNRKEEQ